MTSKEYLAPRLLLGMILTGHLEEPKNFFYHYCRMVLHPFALLEFERKERVKGGTDLLITSTILGLLVEQGSTKAAKIVPVIVTASHISLTKRWISIL